MRASELTVEVRDRTLARKGQILPRELVMKAKLRWCGVGEWELTLPGDHPMVPHLETAGSGLVVTARDSFGVLLDTLFSGPTITPHRKRDLKNPDGTLTFKGVTDEILLEDAEAFPDPATADPTAQTKANDIRTGSTVALMRQYVAYNIASTHAPAGRLRGFRQYVKNSTGPTTGGITQQKSPRFQNLLELLQELAIADGGWGFRMVQVGAFIEFQPVAVVDRRGTIRLDIANGTLTAEETTLQGPTLTDAIVAGQGEGVNRRIVRRQDTSSEATWGRPIERFFDRRDTDDTTELQLKGDEELAAAEGGLAAKVIPTDDTTMQYLKDWRQGDWITVVVNGVERTSVVTEAVLAFNDKFQGVGVTVGDVTTFDPRDKAGKQQQSIDSRLAYLERTGGIPARLGDVNGQVVTDCDDAILQGWYYGVSPINGPTSTGLAHITVFRAGATNQAIRQEFRRIYADSGNLTGPATDNRVWVRTSPDSGANWTPWVLIGANSLPSRQQWYSAGVQSISAGSFTDVAGSELTFDIPQPMLVQISLNAWMVATAGELRASVAITGATSGAPPLPGWGATLYASAADTTATMQRSLSFSQELNAGDNRIKVRAYQTGGGSKQLNYTVLDVAPIRWL